MPFFHIGEENMKTVIYGTLFDPHGNWIGGGLHFTLTLIYIL